MRKAMTALCGCGVALGLLGCSQEAPDPIQHGSAAARLTPLTKPLEPPIMRRTVYVPVYSSIYLGVDIRRSMIELAATISIRNVSSRQTLVLDSVQYYDSAGKLVREYLENPAELAPLASVEFVVQRNDTTGGPGANFLVHLSGPEALPEPLIEAIMIGQAGNAGFSFTSAGRVVQEP
jgi:hypothetical protein